MSTEYEKKLYNLSPNTQLISLHKLFPINSRFQSHLFRFKFSVALVYSNNLITKYLMFHCPAFDNICKSYNL